MDPENSEVVADVAALAAQAENAEGNAEILEAVLENAQDRIEQAEQTAEQIAAAAMESARGREIEELRKDFYTWQEKQAETERQILQFSEQLATLTGQISALATLAVAPEQKDLSLSNPMPSAVPEAIAEVEQIIPESLKSAVEENPVPQIPAKPKRLWM